MNITEIMESLSNERPIFYSEADFQFALAWKIQQYHPSYNIRMEYPVTIDENNNRNIDIFFDGDGDRYGIELKYKTRRMNDQGVVINNEQYNLTDQGARDTGMYDTLKDVHRLETLLNGEMITIGHVIILTNDANYWDTEGDGNAFDQFQIYDGRMINAGEELEWQNNAVQAQGYAEPIRLENDYTCNWTDYSKLVDVNKHNEFRYLLFNVGG